MVLFVYYGFIKKNSKNITNKDVYKPNIALVLTGHYRSFDITVKDQNVTYYCNTWDTIDSITYSWHKG